MKQCKICGAAIPDTRTSNNTKYCSPKCAREAEAQQNIKAISRRAYNINKVSYLVYKAYDFKCAICKWQATKELISFNGKVQHSHGNEIHHIEPIRENGKETADNLILLCPNHHKQADLGIISREELKKYTVPFEITKEQKDIAKADCVDAISNLIF